MRAPWPWLAAPCLLALIAPPRAAANALTVYFPEKPPAATAANVVQDNFLGISHELSPFDYLWGDSPDTLPSAMINYLSNVRARIAHPLRIRVGGSGMDSSTYVANQSAMIVVPDPNAYFNDIPCDFGPRFFEVLAAMERVVGSMQFIIGLSMQNTDDDSNVLELAAAARSYLGDSLDAMLLGNEPDLYSKHGTIAGYSLQNDYIPGVTKIINDLTTGPYGNLLNETLIGGPTICCDWDLGGVITAGLDALPYKYYTIQHYPMNICGGPDAHNTNISYFLSHSNLPGYVSWNIAGVNLGRAAGVPALLTEYNTVSCGGSNISDTFAATMWLLDAGLQFATQNLSGIYIHTREFNITYNLFSPPAPSPSAAQQPGWTTGASYYALLAMAEALSPSGSAVLDLNLNRSLTNPHATVAAYGVYDRGGTARGKLVLFNYARSGAQTFTLPANLTNNGTIGTRLLLAPSVTSRDNITWAGQTILANGALSGAAVSGAAATTYTPCARGCNVSVPGPGVALVLLDVGAAGADVFYDGNSTIAAALPAEGKSAQSGARTTFGRVELGAERRTLVVLLAMVSVAVLSL